MDSNSTPTRVKLIRTLHAAPTSKAYTWSHVADEKKPKVKQEFQTIELAFNFYNANAGNVGLVQWIIIVEKEKEQMR